jgi:mannose-6-phosphate isomerase-like protein (cupin superfamily)
MSSTEFPPFVRSLPEADLPFEGLRGWLAQSESSLLMFMESAVEVAVPEHSHGDQWGITIDGRIDLTIGGVLHTFTRGDSYFIPAGTPHRATIYPGFRAIDYFAERDRFRTKRK